MLLAGADEAGSAIVTTVAAVAVAREHSDQSDMILLCREKTENSCPRNRNSRVVVVCSIASLEVQGSNTQLIQQRPTRRLAPKASLERTAAVHSGDAGCGWKTY